MSIASGTRDNIGQDAANPVEQQAGIGAARQVFALLTGTAGALHQITDFEIEMAGVAIGTIRDSLQFHVAITQKTSMLVAS